MDTAQRVLDEGLADAVSLDALLLANPDLPARIQADGPFNTSDESAYYGGDHRGCPDYPVLGQGSGVLHTPTTSEVLLALPLRRNCAVDGSPVPIVRVTSPRCGS